MLGELNMNYNAIMEVLGAIIKGEIYNISVIVNNSVANTIGVDEDDVDDFMSKFCLCHGIKNKIYHYIADECLYEFKRRMSRFNCVSSDSYKFIAGEVSSYLLSFNFDSHGDGPFYSSFRTMITNGETHDYVLLTIKDEYYLFDFKGLKGISLVDGKYKEYISNEHIADIDWDICAMLARDKIGNFIKDNIKNYDKG